MKKIAIPTATAARIKSRLFGLSARSSAAGVSVAVGDGARSRVDVGERLGVKVGLGESVSVAGTVVGVLVAGGVTCSSSLSPG